MCTYNVLILIFFILKGSPDEEKKRLIRHARKKAAEDAWIREADLIRGGYKGSRSWNPEEKRELFFFIWTSF